jgi:hypothetical protein
MAIEELTCNEYNHDAAAAIECAGDADRGEDAPGTTDGLLTYLGVRVTHLKGSYRPYIHK